MKAEDLIDEEKWDRAGSYARAIVSLFDVTDAPPDTCVVALARVLSILAGHGECVAGEECPMDTPEMNATGDAICKILNASGLNAGQVMLIYSGVLAGTAYAIGQEMGKKKERGGEAKKDKPLDDNPWTAIMERMREKL